VDPNAGAEQLTVAEVALLVLHPNIDVDPDPTVAG
jgi:hypothetical protein